MVAFEIDPPQNLLVIRYRGSVGPDETERGLEEVRTALAQLQSGFRLLADLSELQSMEVSCAPHIEGAMDLCNEKGASIVVRVIPDPTRDIGLQIMSLFHYGHDVRIVTCETLGEAKDILLAEP
jgi:anti-anti-sigma regulatory factor